MATLQNIRNRAGLLVSIVIGLSLLAFILTDLLSAGNSLFRSNQYEIGSVNGTSIQYPEFQRGIEELTEVYKMNTGQTQMTEQLQTQIQEQIWMEFVRNGIMADIYENLGIDVSDDESYDMIQGSNIHPLIQQTFANPETGMFDKSLVINFIRYVDEQGTPEQQAYWRYLEKQITADRKYSKYINLVKQGLYVTNSEAEQELANNSSLANIQYIYLPFSALPDSTVAVTEKELKDYYNSNKDKYTQEASRAVQYVSFPVEATEDDDQNALKWMEDIKADFIAAENNEQFISVNSDVPFDDFFQKKEEISDENLVKLAFTDEPGTVYGPYKEGNTYKIAKLDIRKNMPDSVNARHILLDPNTVGMNKITFLADSLKQLIEKGANFANLAKEYSADQGSAIIGGDLGWFERGMMVKPFEDACFNGTEKGVYIVPTQYGLHIIQLIKKGKEVPQARIAFLTRNIEPGTPTFQQVYAKASQFASQSTTIKGFDEAVKEQGLTKRSSVVNKNDASFMGLEQSRQIVRATWQAKKPSVLVNNEGSSIFDLNNSYVVAALVSIQEEGHNPFEQVKPIVALDVRQEAKAKILSDKVKNATASESDIYVIANALNAESYDAEGVSFNAYNIPLLGAEPKVQGAVSTMREGQLSHPIEGRSGVYLVKITSTTQNEVDDLDAEKLRLKTDLYQLTYTIFGTLRDAAEVVDNRIKFY